MPTPGKLQHINFNILLTMIMMPTPGGGGGGGVVQQLFLDFAQAS